MPPRSQLGSRVQSRIFHVDKTLAQLTPNQGCMMELQQILWLKGLAGWLAGDVDWESGARFWHELCCLNYESMLSSRLLGCADNRHSGGRGILWLNRD